MCLQSRSVVGGERCQAPSFYRIETTRPNASLRNGFLPPRNSHAGNRGTRHGVRVDSSADIIHCNHAILSTTWNSHHGDFVFVKRPNSSNRHIIIMQTQSQHPSTPTSEP